MVAFSKGLAALLLCISSSAERQELDAEFVSSLVQHKTKSVHASSKSGLVASQCAGPDGIEIRVRREVRDMSAGSWKLLKDTWRSLYASGDYDKYGVIHSQHYYDPLNDHGVHHEQINFLPFHRQFSLDLELDLRSHAEAKQLIPANSAVGLCDIILPYWDWTKHMIKDVLNADFLGTTDREGCIVDGLPGGWTTPADWLKSTRDQERKDGFRNDPLRGGDAPCVKRNAKGDLIPAKYDAPTVYGIHNENFLKMSEALEGMHGAVHVSIGGNMKHRAGFHSPSDPVFFFHHNFVDALWFRWQHGMASQETPVEINQYVREPLHPWASGFNAERRCALVPGSSSSPSVADVCLQYQGPSAQSYDSPCGRLQAQIVNGLCSHEELQNIPCVNSPECVRPIDHTVCGDEFEEDCPEIEDTTDRETSAVCRSFVLLEEGQETYGCHLCNYSCKEGYIWW